MSQSTRQYTTVVPQLPTRSDHREEQPLQQLPIACYLPLPASQLPSFPASQVRETRERLNVSSVVFARRLRVSTRTLENW